MAVRLRNVLFSSVDQLRYEPTEKRVRALLGEETVVDSRQALLIWEPRRVVPSYAVPARDILAELSPSARPEDAASERGAALGGPRVLYPGIPFQVRSSEGQALTLTAGDARRDGAAFRLADPDLAGHVVLDFTAFDTWLEEDDPIVAHPRDPFHRVDIRHSSRNVRIELDGQVLADSSRPVLVFETGLPTRYYLPREDVRTDLLRPRETRTSCGYKGVASYWSVDLGEKQVDDLVWSYEQPLADAHELTGLMAFFDERLDVFIDGERRVGRARPRRAPDDR